MKTHLIYVAIIVLLIIGGCMVLEDKWPAPISKSLTDYAEVDPNSFGLWPDVGELKTTIQIAEIKHSLTQAKYEYYKQRDGLTAVPLLNQSYTTLQQVLREREETIGKEGWAMSILTGVLGTLGGGGLVNYFKNRTTYSEIEVNEIKKNNGVA